MLILVGLGNPGSQYQNTRHNAGFLLIDQLAEDFGISITEKKFEALCGKGKIDGHDVLLLKPQTFMNCSGSSVQKALSFFKIPENHMIVVFDDLDLPFGQIKTRFGGGHSGHNGVRSILDHVSNDKFYRLKIGIGRPVYKQDTSQWVLHPFNANEFNILQNEIFPLAKKRVSSVFHEITHKNTETK